MFKVGDIVYCIEILKNVSVFSSNRLEYLKLNTPYVVYIVGDMLVQLEGISVGYTKDRFVSEKEYQRGKRLEKIKKIKECITQINY